MFKNFKKKFKNEKGLTLVELLAVIVILAIIAVIAFVFIGGIIDNSKKDAHIANAQQVVAAAKLYETTENEISGTMKLTDLQTKGYLEDDMKDPDTKDSEGYVTESDTVTGKQDGYKITFKSKKCTITEKSEEDLLKKDREDICD